MKRILLATNGSGYQIDRCLDLDFFRKSINIIVSDRPCGALDVARKHQIDHLDLAETDSNRLNAAILGLVVQRDIDCIISPGFTRVFAGELLEHYQNRIFNCHPSILPAFKGFYDTRDTNRKFHARQIWERTLDYGSRVTGNTIHVVSEKVDEGYPIVVSTLNIPYGEDPALARHRLFIQECKCLLQFVSWFNQDRLFYDVNGYPFIKGARFDAPFFSPNLEDESIIEFDLRFPNRSNENSK